jgi:hypothetical protein
MERGRRTCDFDFTADSSEVGVDAIDREAQDGVAETPEAVVPFSIVLALLLVNLPVDLDDETVSGTREIDNVGADRMLPTKLPALKPMIPEYLPETPFGWRRPAPEIPRRLKAPEPSRRTAPLIAHHDAVSLSSCHAAAGWPRYLGMAPLP